MKKRRMNPVAGTIGLLMAGVLTLGVIESDATTVNDHIVIPGDPQMVAYGDALELDMFTTYTNSGDLRGQFSYGPDGKLYHSVETLEYEDEEGYKVKKVWNVSTSKATAELYLYTYRNEGNETFCYMDKYKNGMFDYGSSWVNSQDGDTQFYVKYDSAGNVKKMECTYYDEEGRPAYILSGMTDLEKIDWNETDIFSYEYCENGVACGYIQKGQTGERVPCYRKEVSENQIMLEMEYTASSVETLDWYMYDKDGRILYKISVSPAWNKEYSEINLEHYLYSGSSMLMAKYIYDVQGDILIQNTGSNMDAERSFQACFGKSGYPIEIIAQNSATDTIMIRYNKATGAMEKIIMGEE